MHTALIANTWFVEHELAYYRSLVEGLTDAGVQVSQVLPEELELEGELGFSSHRWPETGVGFWSRHRLGALAEPLAAQETQLVHGLCAEVWRGALDLSRKLGLPAVLTAWSMDDLAWIDRLRRPIFELRPTFTAASGPLAQAIIEQLRGELHVEVIPMAVATTQEPAASLEAGVPLCVIITGDGSDDEHYEALLQAARDFVQDHPHTQFFLDGEADQHDLWQLVHRLSLHGNVSLVPQRLGRGELLMGAHAVVQPQARGRPRGVALRAMGRGLPVLAMRDPWVDDLIDDRTAWLVEEPGVFAWRSLLDRLVLQPGKSSQLGDRARQWIAEHRRAGRLHAQLADLYRRAAGVSLKFTR